MAGFLPARCEGRQLGAQCATSREQMLAAIHFRETERFGKLGVTPAVEIVEQHDGSRIALKKLNAEYNIHDKLAAMSFLLHHAAEGQIVTGLLYVDSDPDDLHTHLATVAAPLNSLGEKELCPGSAVLERFNASLR